MVEDSFVTNLFLSNMKRLKVKVKRWLNTGTYSYLNSKIIIVNFFDFLRRVRFFILALKI